MDKIKHEHLPIDEIILLDENPREITQENLKKLSEEIQADPLFLFQRPSLINHKDGKYYCYAGTQRIKAQKLLGKQTAICFVEDNVSEEIQKKRMLKDNLHRGKWDANKLFELDFELEELEEIGFDFDELNIDTDLFAEPTELTSELKNNPPSIKIVFENEKQMNQFIKDLDQQIEQNDQYQGLSYSVSQGEL